MESFLPRAGTFPWFAFNSCSFSAWLTSEEINPKSTNVAPELSKKIIPLLPPSLSKYFKEKTSPAYVTVLKKMNKNFQNSDNSDNFCFQASSHFLLPFFFLVVLTWFLIQKWGKDASFLRSWGKKWTQECQQEVWAVLWAGCLSHPDGNPDYSQVTSSCLRKDLPLQWEECSACTKGKWNELWNTSQGRTGNLNNSMWCMNSTAWEEKLSSTWGFSVHLFPTTKSSSPGTSCLLSGILWKSIPDVPPVKCPYPNTISIWNVHHFKTHE